MVPTASDVWLIAILDKFSELMQSLFFFFFLVGLNPVDFLMTALPGIGCSGLCDNGFQLFISAITAGGHVHVHSPFHAVAPAIGAKEFGVLCSKVGKWKWYFYRGDFMT